MDGDMTRVKTQQENVLVSWVGILDTEKSPGGSNERVK